MQTARSDSYRPAFWFLLLIIVVLAVLFWRSFVPGQSLFSNDGPLAAQKAAWTQCPGALTGTWDDLNSLGTNVGALAPGFSAVFKMVLGPEGFQNFAPVIILLITGMSVWYFFRRLGFVVLACGLGGLAAVVNSDFFSTVCWGVHPQVTCFAMNFLAMGLVVANSSESRAAIRWVRLILAGMAVGVGVMEAADIGALFSLLTASFVFYYSLVEEGKGGVGLKLGRGVGRTIIIAMFAGFVAISAISSLVSTQIQGIVGTQQDASTKAAHWYQATQWSMPKLETLGIAVPGLFGYRIYGATPEALYWGGVGRDPRADAYFDKGEPPPAGALLHFCGSGVYMGVAVLLVVLWTVVQSARRTGSVFSPGQRKLLWFWTAVAVLSLLLSFGRFSYFYQFFYALPYASTIRNPIKFLHIMTVALLVIFGYGVDALCRLYLNGAGQWVGGVADGWAKINLFDKRFVKGLGLLLVGGLLACWQYASHREALSQYLQTMAAFDASSAGVLADFSIRQVVWTLFFLALSVGVLSWILTGAARSKGWPWGAIALGAILVVDLGRGDLPWLYYWNVEEKYASNPIIDILRDKPYEHRVAMLPFPMPQQLGLFSQIYQREWREQHYLYYNIQNLDVVQQPRKPVDMAAFEGALAEDGNNFFHLVRLWQLTNTRYLLGPAGYLKALNEQVDPTLQRFHIAASFDLVPKPGVVEVTRLEQLTAVLKPEGLYALFEFSGALPRASLYTRWQVSTNDMATLQAIGSPSFDPAQTVLVSEPLAASDPANAAKQSSASVAYTSYTPKRIVLQSRAEAPTVLLLNDKYDPSWRVLVDGKPSTMLRCNFIMRGVSLPAGPHTIEFLFDTPHQLLYVSLAAAVIGILLTGLLVFAGRKND